MKKSIIDNQINQISLVDFSFSVGYKSTPGKGTLARLLKAIKDINIFSILEFQGDIYIDKKEVSQFQSEYQSFNSILSNCDISSQQIRKLIKQYNIPYISFGQTYDQFFMKKSDAIKFIYDDRFIDGYELISILGIDNLSKKKFPRSAKKSVIENIKRNHTLCELIGYKEIQYPLFFKSSPYPQVDVFEKQKVSTFLDSHIATINILPDFNMNRGNLLSMLKEYNIPIYSFYANHKFKFISKSNYYYLKEHKKVLKDGASSFFIKNNKYKNLVMSGKYYTKGQARELLNLSSDIFPNVISDYKIQSKEILTINDRKIYFYSRNDINNLLLHQNELKKQYEAKYYTLQQIKEIYSNKFIENIIFNAVNRGDIETIKLPNILKGTITKFTATKLYNQYDVESCISKYETNKEISSVSLDSPFLEFIYKTETVLKVSFSEKLKETKMLWYQFVKIKLNSTSTLKISSFINQLSRISEVLSTSLSKEIYNYKVEDLNTLVLNEESTIPVSYKRIIYDFCHSVSKSLNEKLDKPRFQIQLLNNPYHINEDRILEKSRYSLEEYQLLYMYTSNLSIHKIEAIKDVESLLNGGNYYHYDSYWVYILTHLTNNWRHSTIISQIPEVDLNNTNIKDLNWLKNNDLSIEDANSIIFQIGRKIHKISKTGAETVFRIAEPLRIPFATAISICQFRANTYVNKNSLRSLETGPLLWLNSKRIIHERYQVYKMYFRDFIPNFLFSNRKMNRTLTTLIWSVHRSLKVAQVSRGHYSEESTMYYIKLNDTQVHELVNQLFERNSFGYLTQLLTQKLFNYEISNKYSETKKMLGIYEKFGDIHKIEVTTGLLNQIAKQQEDILTFVNGLTNDEAQTILSKSMTNTLYSKRKHYQCVFADCKFTAENEAVPDCINCPYSIINVYTLSNLMDLYLKKIQDLIQKFDSAKLGEKHKMANHFFLIWRQIQMAKMRFGDVIYDFVEGGKERFKHLAKHLPKTKEYLTDNFDLPK